MRGLAGAGSGCTVGQGYPLLVHSLGLRAHDETEEVLIWYGGPSSRRRGRSTALVVQTGALKENRTLDYQSVCFHRAFSKIGAIGYLALDKHVKEILVGLGAVGVGHQVAEHRLVAALMEPETRQASACCRRLLHPPALGA